MAKIGADTSGLQSALKDINSSLKSTDSELYKVNKSIKSAEQAGTDRTDILKQKEEVLGQAISETSEKLEKLKSIEEQMKNAADNNNISAEQYRDYQRELSNTEAQLRRYQTQLAETQDQQAGLNTSNQQVVTGLQDVGNAYQAVVNDIKFFTDALSDAAKKAVSYSETAVKAALKTGSEFESAMSKVQAYSGASGEAFTELENAAKEAGATTSKSAKEAADALGYMALAGWDTEEMLDGLMPVLRASEAGGADLGRTSDLVTDSMSAMGIATDDLTHYLDVCTAAQSNSSTTLTGLLEAYVGCGGTLRNLNIPLEESAALLGTLANRGIKASEAGTALNSILVNLVGANKNAKGAMDELGVSAWDEEGKFIGLSETLKLLKTALADCTDEQKAFFEAKIGGKTQMDTLQALISGVGEEYDDLYDTLMNANGALETTAKTMQDNLAGAVTTMRSALETLRIEFYDYLEEPAKEAVNAVTEALRELTDSVDKGKLGEALENLSGKIADLIEKLAEFASEKGIELVIDGLTEFIDLLSWLTDNLDTVTAAVKGFGAAFLAIKLGQLGADIAVLIGTISTLAAAAEAGSVAATVLSAALNAIPFVAVGALAIGAAVAFTSYMDSVMDAKVRLEDLHTETDEVIEQFTEEISKIQDVNNEIDENTDKIDKNCDKAHDLWEQLKDLCDEEGNINGEYSEAQSLIDELNVLTDSHITLINGQIQGYDDLCDSMDNYIERLRSTAKLEYMHDDYVKAIGRRDEIQADIDSAKADAASAKSKRVSAESARSRGGITSVSALGIDPFEIAQSADWQNFAAWYQARYKVSPDPAIYDDYIEFLKFQEQMAENKVHTAEAAYKSNQSIIDRYETESANLTKTEQAGKTDNKKTPAQLAGEEYGKTSEKTSKKSAQDKAAQDRQTMADVIGELDQIEQDYAFGNIKSEEDYYSQLGKIVEDNKSLFYQNTDSDEYKKFKKYLDKVNSYKNKKSGSGSKSGGKSGSKSGTDPESIASKAISAKKTDLNLKKSEDENYSDEDYYNDLEAFAEKELDHSTAAYKTLLTEINNYRKTQLENADKQKQTEAKQNAKNKIAGIKDKAKEASGYDTSSPEYWENLEKEFENADFTELEKGTDEYLNAKADIANGKKEAKYKKNLADAKAAVDELVTKYENGDEEISTAEILKEKVDAVVSEWKSKNIDITKYAADKLSKAKAPSKSGREQAYDKALSDVEHKHNTDGYASEEEYTAARKKVQEDYSDLKGISETWHKNQKSLAEGDFNDLYKKYKKGEIDYKTFTENYSKLHEEWIGKEIDLDEYSEDEREKARKAEITNGENELKDVKKLYDDKTIPYEKYLQRVGEIREKYSGIGITLDSSENDKKVLDTETAGAKSEYDTIADSYKNGLIAEENYQKQKLDIIQKYAEKSIDISEYIADKEIEIADSQLDGIKKKYESLNAEIAGRASEIAKGSLGSGSLYEDKTISGGGKKKIFTDLNAKANDIKKYTEDLKKLRETGAPPELMQEILSMDFESRKEVIRELLKMSESKRDLYYTDYKNWQAEAKKAAEIEFSDEKTAIDEELKDSADSALSASVDIASAYGKDAAKAYINSWNEVLKSNGLAMINPELGTPKGSNNSTSAADNAKKGDTYISASQPISISIAGTSVIKTIVGELLRQSGLIGRANSRL